MLSLKRNNIFLVDPAVSVGRQGCRVACSSQRHGGPSLQAADIPPTKQTFGFYKYNCYVNPQPDATVPQHAGKEVSLRVQGHSVTTEEVKHVQQEAVVLVRSPKS